MPTSCASTQRPVALSASILRPALFLGSRAKMRKCLAAQLRAAPSLCLQLSEQVPGHWNCLPQACKIVRPAQLAVTSRGQNEGLILLRSASSCQPRRSCSSPNRSAPRAESLRFAVCDLLGAFQHLDGLPGNARKL